MSSLMVSSQDLWVPIDAPGELPCAIILDPDLSADFDTIFDEIVDFYDGDFVPLQPSELAMLLILAKRCYQDGRFQKDQQKLEFLIKEMSEFASTTLKHLPAIDPQQVSQISEHSTLDDAILNLRLALQLGEQAFVVLGKGEEPVLATLVSFPQYREENLVRLWFSYDHEVLSKQIPWHELPKTIMNGVWDFSLATAEGF